MAIQTIFCAILLILLSHFSPVMSNENEGYSYYHEVGMFYKLISKDKINWYASLKYCESENSTLAMPRNLAEAKILMDIFAIHYDFLPIGFHNKFAPEEYITVNGEALQYYYNVWDTNMPDKKFGTCGYISRKGKLHDGPCVQLRNFICQIETSDRRKPQSDPSCLTEDSEYRFSKDVRKCYKIHMNARGFSDAQAVCKAEGGNLAIIRNLDEENFLMNMFNEAKYKATYTTTPNTVFLGVYTMSEEKFHRTVLGEAFSEVKYANWSPKAAKDGELCVGMNKQGQLEGLICGNKSFFVCEQPSKFYRHHQLSKHVRNTLDFKANDRDDAHSRCGNQYTTYINYESGCEKNVN